MDVGWRTDQGQISKIERLETMTIPRSVRHRQDMWDPNVCLTFLDRFLTFLRKRMSEEEKAGIWHIWFEPTLGHISVSHALTNEETSVI